MINIAFGPVPSRRLGRSLGINNILCKFCSYDCIYCQAGRTINKTTERRAFYNPEDIFKSVEERINKLSNGKIDYLTFVADGEPTLDINLSKEVEILRDFDIPIAIITNSSLIWRDDVRNDLLNFDLVSFKVDSVNEKIWREINRPHKNLALDKILESMIAFRDNYKGKLITETMILGNINYTEDSIIKTAEFLKELNPDRCYLNIPIRPPSEKYIKFPKIEVITKILSIFNEIIGKNKVELLGKFEGNDFVFSENVEEDILAITSVHPLREDVIKELLNKANISLDIIEKMINEGKLIKLEYNGKIFYIKNMKSRNIY
ncbi:Radical SAM domain protein [Methanocaldococcus bathoardescens]|uniref:Radical SAM domain protein n=1 Tax=Methanocaldococcus bathoardescens TaxID=1301915 RepID=A0A076LAF4_9EURY|nr:radical SAM protein [Methanocaldococcus bathoardescens]AIJ05166.1 Radical SAM domain protein [Methanocaldococcus bathoardescens]